MNKKERLAYKKEHPIRVGKLILCKVSLGSDSDGEYSEYQKGIVVRTKTKYGEKEYLVEFKNGERIWVNWYFSCRGEGRKQTYEDWLDGVEGYDVI